MTVVEEQKLKKCPFCDFINSHEGTITHHIRFTDDAAHIGIDIEKLDKNSYVLVEKPKIRSSPYGLYISNGDLPLPWLSCLWCNYKDKIEFDLSLHFLEDHRKELKAIPITKRERLAAKALIKNPYTRFFSKFESPMEYRLDKAVDMAKEKVTY